jgi:signal peptidase I
MEPTVLKDEKFSVDMDREATATVARGQIILFEHEGIRLMKRVIAVEGDTIEGKDLKIYLNGKLLVESYVQHIGKRPLGTPTLENFGPSTVHTGELFVAGDNRDYSYDSRDPGFGLVSLRDVRGKPKEVVWSPVPERVGHPIH